MHCAYHILGKIGSKMGEICMRQNQRSTIHDPIGTYDFAKDNIAAAFIEFLQELKLLIIILNYTLFRF